MHCDDDRLQDVAEILRALRHDAAERDLIRFLLVREAFAYACDNVN